MIVPNSRFATVPRALPILTVLVGLALDARVASAVTEAQRQQAAQVLASIQTGGELYAAGKFVDSAAKIAQAQRELVQMLTAASVPLPGSPASQDVAGLYRLLQPIHARLVRAHGLLELEGAELEPLPTWGELVKSSQQTTERTQPAGGAEVSFSNDIAPWLVSACGRCHIDNRRGQFSVATYAELRQGVGGAVVLFPGSARGSRIVEVIESGDMPRGGSKVSPQQLLALKAWIDQGAKFDGGDPSSNLRTLVSVNSTAATSPAATTAQQPTGGETVSFAADVAPLLAERCRGCHVASQRASGGLRMDTFAQLLRGGDSGSPIGGGADESLLVKKLKGQSGERMPAGGRDPLTDSQIELIATWVREGAKYDGPTPDSNIDAVVDQAWATAATQAELFARRQELARAAWQRVQPNDQPETASSDEVFVLGNVTPQTTRSLLASLDTALGQAKRLLRQPADEPLIKGGLTVFIPRSRYDYSEFGRMIENRELPKEWLGHWRSGPLEVYGVIVADEVADGKLAEALAMQIVAGSALASHGAPYWFSEGVARNLVSTSYRRSDPRVRLWRQALPAAVLKVDKPATLLEGRLNEETAALVGTGLTNVMLTGNNRRRFDKLLELLRAGQTFDDAFTTTFVPPEQYIQLWLGK